MGFSQETISRLRPLFSQFSIKLEGGCPVWFSIGLPSPALLEACPNFPRSATPLAGRSASGRGLSADACEASCLGEAVELASCCSWGDEEVTYASPADLDAPAICPSALLGLSDEQVTERDKWNSQMGGVDWRPEPLTPDAPCDWFPVTDAHTGALRYVPADAVLIGRATPGAEHVVALADSNGCASGETIVDAQVAATLELIERDAVARWWYGRRSRPLIDWATEIGDCDPLVQYLKNRSRICRLYQISTDLLVPAFAAVSADQDGRDIAIGTAAKLDAHDAVLSAMTEMLQMEISLETSRRATDAANLWGLWRREVDLSVPPLSFAGPIDAIPCSIPLTGADAMAYIFKACDKAGVSIYFTELTRPVFRVPTVRALSVDLCLTKPRFGRKRLLASDTHDLWQPASNRESLGSRVLLV